MNSTSAHPARERNRNNIRGIRETRHFLPICLAASFLLLISCFAARGQTTAKASISSKLDVAPDLAALLAKQKDIPVDIDPVFSFHPPLR